MCPIGWTILGFKYSSQILPQIILEKKNGTLTAKNVSPIWDIVRLYPSKNCSRHASNSPTNKIEIQLHWVKLSKQTAYLRKKQQILFQIKLSKFWDLLWQATKMQQVLA